jgi:hypothetical protein
MLWAYFSFSQYLIIWAGNLPREIAWYEHRLRTGWRFVGVILVLFHFAVPFALLLSRTVKQHARLIAGLAVAIILVRFVDLFWLIAPEFHTHGLAIGWLDLAVPLSLSAGVDSNGRPGNLQLAEDVALTKDARVECSPIKADRARHFCRPENVLCTLYIHAVAIHNELMP